MSGCFFLLIFWAESAFLERNLGKRLDKEIVFNKRVLRRRELNAVVDVAQFQRAADGFDFQLGAQSIQSRKDPLAIGLAAVMFDHRLVLRDENVIAEGRQPGSIADEFLSAIEGLRGFR